jgi:chromosome segregation ATPase
MEELENELTERRKKDLLQLASMTRSYVHAKRLRDMLTSETHALAREIEHFMDMTTALRQRLVEKMAAARPLELKVAQDRNQLRDMQAEKQAAADEAARLKDLELNFQQKLEALMDLKQEIARSRMEAQDTSLRLQASREGCRKALEQQRQMAQGIDEVEQRHLQLELEIPVLQNTRDILVGQTPEGFDPEVFKHLRDDVPRNAESYQGEVSEQTGEIEREISRLKEQVDERNREAQALLSQEQELQNAIEQLARFSVMDENRETVIDEIHLAEEQRSRLSGELERKELESCRLESGITEIGERIEQEKQDTQGLLHRLDHLQSRAKDLDGIDDIPLSMRSLERKATRFQLEIKANMDFSEIFSPMKNDTESMNSSLQEVVEDFLRLSDDLERALGSIAGKLET